MGRQLQLQGNSLQLELLSSCLVLEVLAITKGQFVLVHFEIDILIRVKTIGTRNLYVRRIHHCDIEIIIVTVTSGKTEGEMLFNHARCENVEGHLGTGDRLVG